MDIIHDNSRRQLVQLAAIVGESNLPGYVENYSVPDAKNASALQDEYFADPGKRLYPIDSQGATWLSAGYWALSNPSCMSRNDVFAHPTFGAIKRAAAAWGIAADVDKLVQAVVTYNGPTKSAADNDDNYGWVIRNADGVVIRRRYPIFDAAGVTKAAEFFAENRKHYPREVRQQIAQKILDKAAQFQVSASELPGCVEKEAGHGLPRRTVIMQELNERARLTKDAEFSALLSNTTRLLATADEFELLDAMDKLAEVIDAFDKAEGLVRYYGTKISYPADFLMSVSLKEAQDFTNRVVVLKNHVFDVEKLAKTVPLTEFVAVLGDNFAKQAAVGDKLTPTTLKSALDELTPANKAALERHLVTIYG